MWSALNTGKRKMPDWNMVSDQPSIEEYIVYSPLWFTAISTSGKAVFFVQTCEF